MQFANTTSTIMLRGETGTGKELFARAIHTASSRNNAPFIAINCSAIPDTLLESELFGYEAGAFTGANQRGKPGKFEIADGGTVFLDEIGDMQIHLQAKILRVLQEKSIERIGGHVSIHVDVRIIAATHRTLEQMILTGEFREDLYYRLNVIPLHIPPLRQRKDDIPLLLNYFTKKYNALFNKKVVDFSKQALEKVLSYDWPGNVRELENAMEYAFNMENTSYILEESLPAKLREVSKKQDTILVRPLQDLEKEAIAAALNRFGHDLNGKKQAAEALGIGIATLYRKVKEYQF